MHRVVVPYEVFDRPVVDIADEVDFYVKLYRVYFGVIETGQLVQLFAG